MIPSTPPCVFLDACVMYPAPVVDLLLSLASEGLFRPRWSNMVHEEWVNKLLENQPELKRDQLKKRVNAMNKAFPEASISHFKPLIQQLKLPDPNDRHVLAASIKGRVESIITFNVKDFPEMYIQSFKISIQHPDSFISHWIDSNRDHACNAFHKQIQRLKNPPIGSEKLLKILEQCGLPKSAKKLSKQCARN